jgi:hypothetical protein
MSTPPNSPADPVAARLAALEARVAQLESRMHAPAVIEPVALALPVAAQITPPLAPSHASEDELEFEVGQNWFAVAGVVALTAGAGLLLSFPYAGLPVVVPSAAGYLAALLLVAVAHLWRSSFEIVAGYLRAVAMALLCFATLRLCFPAARQVCDPQGFAGRTFLLVALGLNVALALRRRSPWLLGLALTSGATLLLATGLEVIFSAGLVGLAALATVSSHRRRWPVLPVVSLPVLSAAYFAWALGNPFFAPKLGFGPVAALAPLFFLAAVTVLAVGPLLGPPAAEEEVSTKVGALVTCVAGYCTFLVTTLAAFPRGFAALQAIASLVFLGLAAAHWHRREHHVATFFYAMTGYAALTMAILKLAPVPEAFVWLSLQSIVVVATAIWFRSRLIVVANFVIYLGIVVAYVVLADRENGISLSFGLVALGTARLLDWQKDRLALHTELMRNAYLGCAFVVFPYALAHWVPDHLVVVAWIALASGYYAMNLIVTNRKYRWMGHGTLLLASI